MYLKIESFLFKVWNLDQLACCSIQSFEDIDGWMDILLDIQTDRQAGGLTDSKTDIGNIVKGEMYGLKDRQTDGQPEWDKMMD